MSFDPNEPDVWGRTGQAKVDAAKQRGENVPEGFDYSRFDLSKALDTQGPSMPNLFPTSPASYSGSDTSPYSSIGYSSSSGGGTWIAIILILLAIGYFVGADAAVAAAGFMLGLMILGFGFFVLCKMLDIGVSIVKWVFRFLFPASLLAGLIYLGWLFYTDYANPSTQTAPTVALSASVPGSSPARGALVAPSGRAEVNLPPVIGTAASSSYTPASSPPPQQYQQNHKYALAATRRWIIIASRPTVSEAMSLAAQYRERFNNTEVFLSRNGWYAITIGTIEYPGQVNLKDSWISDGLIPSDSYLANGTAFLEEYKR